MSENHHNRLNEALRQISGDQADPAAPGSIRDQLAGAFDDTELLFLDGDGFDGAIVGVAKRCGEPMIVVYDRGRLLDALMAMGMDDDEAREYLSVNIEEAHVGPDTPAVLTPLEYLGIEAAPGAPGDTDAERAAWLADKIGALGDYGKEAAAMLRRWPVTPAADEDREAVLACLGDDAARIRELAGDDPSLTGGANPVSEEWADTMDAAARLIEGRPFSCEYCGGNDERPQGHCTDCTRPR
jgi:hypothetical protein